DSDKSVCLRSGGVRRSRIRRRSAIRVVWSPTVGLRSSGIRHWLSVANPSRLRKWPKELSPFGLCPYPAQQAADKAAQLFFSGGDRGNQMKVQEHPDLLAYWREHVLANLQEIRSGRRQRTCAVYGLARSAYRSASIPRSARRWPLWPAPLEPAAVASAVVRKHPPPTPAVFLPRSRPARCSRKAVVANRRRGFRRCVLGRHRRDGPLMARARRQLGGGRLHCLR